MSDGGRDSSGEPHSVAECLDELHHNIEGMIKVPRMPHAVRIMLLAARSQMAELRVAIERDLPSAPPEAPFAAEEHPR